MVSSTLRPHFTLGKDPVPIRQEAGWAPGPVWTDGKYRPRRDSIPDRPARRQSLYRLSYPAHKRNEYQEYFLGGGGGLSWPVRRADNLITFMCPIVLKSGSHSLVEPSGPSQGLLFLYRDTDLIAILVHAQKDRAACAYILRKLSLLSGASVWFKNLKQVIMYEIRTAMISQVVLCFVAPRDV